MGENFLNRDERVKDTMISSIKINDVGIEARFSAGERDDWMRNRIVIGCVLFAFVLDTCIYIYIYMYNLLSHL